MSPSDARPSPSLRFLPLSPSALQFTDLPGARATFATLQAHAALQSIELRPPPPEPTSCCGRGCHGCVWEGFFAAAQYWRDEAVLLLHIEPM